jgi:hypothetical protein
MSKLLVAATALAAALFAGSSTQAQAQAQADANCQIVDVSVFTDRVHVRCNVNPAGAALMFQSGQSVIYYFAVANSSPYATSFLALATAAKQANKSLVITYRTAPGSNPPGCAASDCRGAIAARLYY